MRLQTQKQSATRQSPSVAIARPRQTFFAENHGRPAVLDRQFNQTGHRGLGFSSAELDTTRDQTVSARFSHNFGEIPIFSKSDTRIQAKLATGEPNDAFEQEADRVAARVLRMPEPQLQRACDCGGGCSSCHAEAQRSERDRVQTKSVGASNSSQIAAPPIVSEALTSPGQPLDGQTREYMEPRFGHDFGRVRIHTGARAAESARALNALAFTAGDNVVFGDGQYRPETNYGKRLLAHELVHVIQQSGGLWPALHRTSERADDASEWMDPPVAKKPLDPASGEGKLVVSSRVRPALQRWKISGNDATADQDDDTLPALAEAVGAKSNDWKCIRPIRMSIAESTAQPADFNERYERHVAVGDTFDVSNLTEWAGPMIAIHLFATTNKYARLIKKFYPGSIAVTDVDGAIGAASLLGTMPIADMVIVGHAHGGTMFGDASVFTPSALDSEQSSPSFAATQLGIFPRRCWFTRSARVRSVGCDSEAWGQDFASHFLRQGTIVTTTTASVRGRCIGTTMASLPTGGECGELDSLDFAACFFVDCSLLEGPFATVEQFHAGTYWSDVKGKL